MKVKDFIEELKRLDPDKDILFYTKISNDDIELQFGRVDDDNYIAWIDLKPS